MESDALFSSLERVAAQLPFGLHETDKVNAAFEDWMQRGDEDQKRIVDLWTYCFVRRYILLKFTVDRSASAADLEVLVDRVYRRIDEKRDTVIDARRYAGWVSVVCKNAYLNHRRSAVRTVPLGPGEAMLMVSEPAEIPYDTVVLLDTLHAAVERLPPYLREIAGLRFLQEVSYEEISYRTDLPLPIIRSYVSKILRRLREDPALERVLRPGAEESVR